MITIEQLLESVDLDFEPRFVTKSNNDHIDIFDAKPESTRSGIWWTNDIKRNFACIGYLKIAEFDGKPWNECIYEVPRKTTDKGKPMTSNLKCPFCQQELCQDYTGVMY